MDNYQNVCYLIHFDEPIGNSQHYLGYASDLRVRIAQHRSGKAAKLTTIAKSRGISWRVVRVWGNADVSAEKYLKGLGASNLCPHCSRYIRGLSPVSHSEKVQGRASLPH